MCRSGWIVVVVNVSISNGTRRLPGAQDDRGVHRPVILGRRRVTGQRHGDLRVVYRRLVGVIVSTRAPPGRTLPPPSMCSLGTFGSTIVVVAEPGDTTE